MVTLKCLASGSSGNCYVLENDKEKLLLDLGLTKSEIVKGMGYDISHVVGCIVTHKHKDHSKSQRDFQDIFIPVYAPYEQESKNIGKKKFGNFTVMSIPMLDKNMEIWQHTNSDGSQCPCYGFLITHPDMGKLLYITDTKLITYIFLKQKINHMLIGTNFDEETITSDIAKRNHVITGHMSLQQVTKFVKINETNSLRNVIMCHLSEENSDAEHFINEMKKVVKNANVNVAKVGFEVDVNEVPF